MDAYLNLVAKVYNVPVDNRIEWKRRIIKSPVIRRKFREDVNYAWKHRDCPEWKRMCKHNPVFKTLSDLAEEEELQFKFDEDELN